MSEKSTQAERRCKRVWTCQCTDRPAAFLAFLPAGFSGASSVAARFSSSVSDGKTCLGHTTLKGNHLCACGKSDYPALRGQGLGPRQESSEMVKQQQQQQAQEWRRLTFSCPVLLRWVRQMLGQMGVPRLGPGFSAAAILGPSWPSWSFSQILDC